MPDVDTPSGRPSAFVAVSSAASCGNERPVEDGQPSVPLSPVEAPPPGFGIDRLEAADANLQAAAAKKERVEATFGAVRYAAAEACCMAEEVAVLHSSIYALQEQAIMKYIYIYIYKKPLGLKYPSHPFPPLRVM